MITKEHLDKMRHAVGFFYDEPGFRNYYCAEASDVHWLELCELGYAIPRKVCRREIYFAVTDQGKSLIDLDGQRAFARRMVVQHD